MKPDEGEVRRALEARSGEASPEFRARLSGTLQGGRPASVNAMPAAAAAMAIIIALGSVGVLLMARSASRVSNQGSGSGDRYTVVASLMAAKAGPFNACYSMPLPAVPIGCGGVEVTNVDVAAIPGVVTYKNGTIATPVVMLVGRWDGRVLRLTEQPQQTTLKGTQAQLVAQAPPQSTGKPVWQVLDELGRDSESLRKRGIVMLSWGQAKDGVQVTLAVADPQSVQYLYDTYGRIYIMGWLQPVGLQSLASPIPTPTMVEKTPIAMPTFVSLSAPSGKVVWALVAGFDLFRSVDRGKTWEQRRLPPLGGGSGVPELSFADGQEGWWPKVGVPATQCHGQGVEIWHTTDGAASWSQLSLTGIAFDQCKAGLSFVDPMHGFLGASSPSERPTIYRTADGGRSWAGATLPDPPGFVTQGGGSLRPGLVRAFGSILLVTAAWGGQREEYVYRSTDGGASWTYLASIGNSSMRVAFVSASRWLRLIAPSDSVETTDSGKTWHSYPSDYTQAAPIAPDVVFGDSLVGYATVRGVIQRTVDGGLHWEMIKNSWP